MVVLNPACKSESVVATSLYSRLNCSIVNTGAQTVGISQQCDHHDMHSLVWDLAEASSRMRCSWVCATGRRRRSWLSPYRTPPGRPARRGRPAPAGPALSPRRTERRGQRRSAALFAAGRHRCAHFGDEQVPVSDNAARTTSATSSGSPSAISNYKSAANASAT